MTRRTAPKAIAMTPEAAAGQPETTDGAPDVSYPPVERAPTHSGDPADPVAVPAPPVDDFEAWTLSTIARCPYEECPEPTRLVRLAGDWQEKVERGKSIGIVGCGSPWHYATTSMSDGPAPEVARTIPRTGEVRVTLDEAADVSMRETNVGITEAGPGGTMYVVRISPRALVNVLRSAGMREVYAVIETTP